VPQSSASSASSCASESAQTQTQPTTNQASSSGRKSAQTPHTPIRATNTPHSTAEVATGIICVCLPTLAALTHRRPRGPTTSIVNGQSNSRTGRSAGAQSYYNRRKQPHDSDDQTLFHNGDYLELREGANNGASLGAKVPQTAVVTGIIGGARASSTELARDGRGEGGGRGEYGEEMEQGVGNIVKTVRIEQSYV